MKKMKKLFAILMTMAMVMGLSITGFAADDTQTISVDGLAATGKNTAEYYKILEPDVTTKSGYKIVDGVIIDGYTTAELFLAATTENQQKALSSENSNLGKATDMNIRGTTASAVVSAGYYAVNVTNSSTSEEPVVTYNNPMIVSVEYTTATKTADGYEYNAISDDDNNVTAKYTTIPVTKTSDGDDYVEYGETVTYTIKTHIPSQVSTFTLTDTLTGATYIRDTQGVTDNVVVTITGSQTDISSETVTYNDDGQMVITLDKYLSGNAGKEVTVVYKAIVTATKVENSVVPNDSKHTFTPASDKLYTGAMKLTKRGEDDVNKDGIKDPLADAVFVVYKKVDETPYYLKDNQTGDIHSYEWVENIDNANRYTTNEAGEILIDGLEPGTYYFKEVQAPSGYSVNTEDVYATINPVTNTTSESVPVANPALTEMEDTRISALPSTGGMGTTLFTIAGCVIMISAAGLFFATRKKAN